MHLYLAEGPTRTLYLATSSQEELQGRPARVLVFRAAEGKPSQAIVEFLPKDEVDLTNVIKLSNRIIKGCLGLISIAGGMHNTDVTDQFIYYYHCTDIFLAAITSAGEIGNTRPSGSRPEFVAKIHEVGFYSLTSSAWDGPSMYDSAPSPTFPEQADTMLRDSYSGQNTPNPVFEHPCMPLTKIISAGTFYYALEPYWDLSSRLSQRITRDEQASKDIRQYDDRFVWNDYIVRSLLDFRDQLDPLERDDLDRCQFIVSRRAFCRIHPYKYYRCLLYKAT
jgi:synaptojanin